MHASLGHSDRSGPGPDPAFLLDLAAWMDGEADVEQTARVESRLAADPEARALFASARLDPVRPEDLEAAVPLGLVHRLNALGDAPLVETRPASGGATDAPSQLRGPWLLWPVAAAACLGAAFGGWHIGGVTGGPSAAAPVQMAIDAGEADDARTEASFMLAAASFGVFEDTDDASFDLLARAAGEVSGSTGTGVMP